MVLGALLAYSAASYYAKKKGIPVEDLFNWHSCPCSNYTAAASASDDEEEEDWIETENNDVISSNNQLLLNATYSNKHLEKIRRNNCNAAHHDKQQYVST